MSNFKGWTPKRKIKVGLHTVTLDEYEDKKKKKGPGPGRPKGRHLTAEGRDDFMKMCLSRDLPAPMAEYKPFRDIGRQHSIDFVFFNAGLKLALEVEGWGHRTDKRFGEDQFKYNELAIRKYHLIRVKPKQLYEETTFDLIKRFFDE